MIASEHVATLGTRSTISGWAAISPSRKSSRFARHRVHRHPDYPAALGLDRSRSLIRSFHLIHISGSKSSRHQRQSAQLASFVSYEGRSFPKGITISLPQLRVEE